MEIMSKRVAFHSRNKSHKREKDYLIMLMNKTERTFCNTLSTTKINIMTGEINIEQSLTTRLKTSKDKSHHLKPVTVQALEIFSFTS